MTKGQSRDSRPATAQHLALTYYCFGQELDQYDELSDQAFARLAGEYGLPPTSNTWYKALRLARRYRGKRRELERLCRPRADGRRIGGSLVIELMVVENAGQRELLADQAVRLRLNAAELRQRIRLAARRDSLRPGSGRPRKQPMELAEALGHARRDLESLKFHVAAAIKLSRGMKKAHLQEARDVLDRIGAPLKLEERQEEDAAE